MFQSDDRPNRKQRWQFGYALEIAQQYQRG
ncbi:Uncharacterised protein [Vibrio cholerae]|nr:Uncharacterised protein [Vibrio cholerae]